MQDVLDQPDRAPGRGVRTPLYAAMRHMNVANSVVHPGKKGFRGYKFRLSAQCSGGCVYFKGAFFSGCFRFNLRGFQWNTTHCSGSHDLEDRPFGAFCSAVRTE